MSSTTTRTNMEVRVNTQDIRKADRAIRKAFDARGVKQLHTAVAQMTQAMEKMTRATASLTASIKASAEAGKGYQHLTNDLKRARQEAAQLARELDRVRGRAPSGGFGGGGGGGGGGFGGGGPTQYNSGGSAGTGGEARYRAGQMGMPTMNAAATALGAIPYVGLAAGGALMASASYYGRAKADARSRRDTFGFLGGTAGAKLGMRGALASASTGMDPGILAREMGAIDSTLATQRAAASRTSAINMQTGGPGQHPYSTRGVAGMGSRSPGLLGGLMRSLTGQTVNNPNNALTIGDPTMNPLGVAISGGNRVTPGGVAIPTLPTGAEEARLRGAGRVRALAMSRQAARRGAMSSFYGAGGAGNSDLTSMGMKYGLTMDASRNEASQLSRGAGYRVSGQQYGMARSLQTGFGVGQDTTGGLLRSMRHMGEGGAEGANQQIANMLASAIASGLDGSELVEHMQRQSELLKRQLELGQRSIDMAPIHAMTDRLSKRVDPFMASKIVSDFGAAGSRIGMNGAGSQEELLLAQAMGFGGGAEDYMGTMLQMQNPAEVVKALPKLLETVQGNGMSDNAKTFFTQRLLKSYGVNVHGDTARQLVGLNFGEGGATAGNIQDILAAGQKAPGTGTLVAEAALDARKIQAGYKAGAQVRNLESTLISMADSIQTTVGPALTTVSGLLADLGKAAEKGAADVAEDLYGSGGGGATTPGAQGGTGL